MAMTVIILIIAYGLRLFIDQVADKQLTIEATYQFPVDLVFAALTFAAAFVVGKSHSNTVGGIYFAVYIVVAMVSVVLYRRSRKQFDADKFRLSITLFLLNMLIALTTFVSSVRLVAEK